MSNANAAVKIYKCSDIHEVILKILTTDINISACDHLRFKTSLLSVYYQVSI